MRKLEQQSEAFAQKKADATDVLARIEIVEDLIEDRYPGQAFAPYKLWQRQNSRPLWSSKLLKAP